MIKEIDMEKIFQERSVFYNNNPQKEKEELLKIFKPSVFQKAVLGFDIYRYSKYAKAEQIMLPFLFKDLYKTTIKSCLSNEKFFFKEYKKYDDFNQNFLDSGDGGFQIFNNPIEAIIFAIYFQANVKRYNSYGYNYYSRDIIGEITLRFALTYDDIYNYNDNFYGSAIINNSRIMSKDKLNRFLVDTNVNEWFDKVYNCFENISIVTKKDIVDAEILSGQINEDKNTYLFEKNNIKFSSISKIGEIISKSDVNSIYNVFLQVVLNSLNRSKKYRKYTISLGNLNTSGISE